MGIPAHYLLFQKYNFLQKFFWNFRGQQNHLEGLIRHRLLGSTPPFDSPGLGWGWRICISHRFPGDAAAAAAAEPDLRTIACEILRRVWSGKVTGRAR